MPGTMGGRDTLLTVVGVVKDQKYYSLREQFTSLLFLAWSQERQPGLTHRVVLHALTPPAALVQSVKAALAEIDPAV